MKIVPAILSHTMNDYVQTIKLARRLTDRFHIDIIDGEFVDNKTVSPLELQKQIDNKLDIHLMVNDVEKFASDCISLNPYHVILQYESPGDLPKAIEIIVKNGFRAGIAINPQTEVSVLKNYIDKISYVQIMGYEAGFAGTKLQRAVLSRPAEVRALRADIEVGLDGGVTDKTMPAIAKAGFDIVNVNSFLFNNPELDSLSAYSVLLEKSL